MFPLEEGYPHRTRAHRTLPPRSTSGTPRAQRGTLRLREPNVSCQVVKFPDPRRSRAEGATTPAVSEQSVCWVSIIRIALEGGGTVRLDLFPKDTGGGGGGRNNIILRAKRSSRK